jgi:hypothetical protein
MRMNAMRSVGKWLWLCFITITIFQFSMPILGRETKKMSAVIGCPLSVRLKISKTKLRPNEAISIEVDLCNVSNEDVSVFGRLLWGVGGGLSIHVIDQNGNEVMAKEHDEDKVIPSVLKNANAFTTLLSEHFLGVRRSDNVKNLFLNNVGNFRIYVEYQSPVPAEFGPRSGFWSRENGVIRSNEVKVIIAKN